MFWYLFLLLLFCCRFHIFPWIFRNDVYAACRFFFIIPFLFFHFFNVDHVGWWYVFFRIQSLQHNAERLLKLIEGVYRWLPLGTIINNRVLVVHGGISDTTDLDLIKSLDRGKVSFPNYISSFFFTSMHVCGAEKGNNKYNIFSKLV